MSPLLPRYPVYVISKGRATSCLTSRFLRRDGVPHRVVIEPQEHDAYAPEVGAERLLVLPFSNLGQGSIPARNFVWEHAIKTGAERHWIFDDNIAEIRRHYHGCRIPCDAGPALRCVEDFTDRYENLAISGLNYCMFGVPGLPPVVRNVHVYSCFCIQNDLPQRWRGRYNEDTDLCLQVLAAGLCTALIDVFEIVKKASMTMRGGNTDVLYAGDGRLRMARDLERAWPGVASVDRRYGRPQHVIRANWRKFDTPLKLKPGIDLAALAPNEYGLRLVETRPLRSARLGQVRERYQELVGEGAHASV
ncbi:MAG TPA: hypothetical protein VFQ71_07960 [Gaiellales bacterium]|jgi:hypothetical protein|nr:hypothetical protein [Gaiellales bacterium]